MEFPQNTHNWRIISLCVCVCVRIGQLCDRIKGDKFISSNKLEWFLIIIMHTADT